MVERLRLQVALQVTVVVLTLLTLQVHIVSLRKALSHLRVPTAHASGQAPGRTESGRR